MIRIDRSRLIAAIRRHYPDHGENWSIRYADRMIARTDARLETNVREWVDGMPLSDVRFPARDGRAYSILSVMQARANTDFLGALEVMDEFFRDEDAAIAQIRRVVL